MPVFTFQAKGNDGKVFKGELEAASDIEARVKLRAQHLIPLKISVKGTSSKPVQPRGFFGPRVKPKDLQVFTRQFSTLINSGIPVVQSLEILAGAMKNSPTLSNTITMVREEVSKGKRLGEAMERFPTVFDRLYVNLVKAGEEAGVLDTILNRLASYIEKAVKIKNKIKGAMFYPAAVLVVSFLVVSVIMVFVIPKFEELFKSNSMELPFVTQIVVNASRFIQSYWYIVLLTPVAIVAGLISYYATPKGRYDLDKFMLSIPVMGELLIKGSVARFSRTLATLLASGVGILDALEITGRVAGNAVIEKVLIDARAVIAEGKSIVQPLSKSRFIPHMVVQMIGVGEQTGSLDTMLEKIADFFEEEVDYAVDAMTSMIEPILMVFLGGIIGFLVIAMYLPIFKMAGAVAT